MIRFAITTPAERRDYMEESLKLLEWDKDEYLKAYGLKIDPKMLKTQARILPPPEVYFGRNGIARPGTGGRWDLKGKAFLQGNTKPLISWGVCVMGNRTP